MYIFMTRFNTFMNVAITASNVIKLLDTSSVIKLRKIKKITIIIRIVTLSITICN